MDSYPEGKDSELTPGSTGWDYATEDSQSTDVAGIGYGKGVPMGGQLDAGARGNDRAPTFLIMAAKDPVDANLDRIQVVKGWLDAKGVAHEKVFNVAASDSRVIRDNTLSPVGNTVDVGKARYTNSIGASQLAMVWTDPQFDATQSTFYYVRVLQIPTPRHSLYAAVAMKQEHPADHPASIQERAYSSPIWYAP
ncbi:DUF3604 domain-containing protein [bacterium]|nr:DUF3604 domain-containing protein [bacterium]